MLCRAQNIESKKSDVILSRRLNIHIFMFSLNRSGNLHDRNHKLYDNQKSWSLKVTILNTEKQFQLLANLYINFK